MIYSTSAQIGNMQDTAVIFHMLSHCIQYFLLTITFALFDDTCCIIDTVYILTWQTSVPSVEFVHFLCVYIIEIHGVFSGDIGNMLTHRFYSQYAIKCDSLLDDSVVLYSDGRECILHMNYTQKVHCVSNLYLHGLLSYLFLYFDWSSYSQPLWLFFCFQPAVLQKWLTTQPAC